MPDFFFGKGCWRFGRKRPFYLLLLISFYFSTLPTAWAQQSCNTLTEKMDFTVKKVEIKAWWVPESLQKEVEKITGLDQRYEPARLSEAQAYIKDQLITAEENIFLQQIKGSMSVLYITSDVCDISVSSGQKEAKVIFKAWYLRVDLINIGNNLLPIPRSARPVFYESVPRFLQVTKPYLSLSADRNYGPNIRLQTASTLYASSQKKNSSSIELSWDLRKSFTKNFFDADASLHFYRSMIPDSSWGWNAAIYASAQRRPLGIDVNGVRSISITGGTLGSIQKSFFRRINTGFSARLLSSDFVYNNDKAARATEKGLGIFAIVDASPSKGFARWGIWADAAMPANNTLLKSYERLSSRLAYSRSFGKGHRQTDIEVQMAGGHIWNKAPLYNQFYAGNEYWDFLRLPLTSEKGLQMPTGPVFRSVGERAGILGTFNNSGAAQSFWSFNFNLGLPIKRWSRPLIPDVIIAEEPRLITLRSALKSQAQTVENFILDDFIENKGYPDDEKTEALAKKIIDKDIRPTLNYLAENANLYAIKPVLLADIAGSWFPSTGYTHWLAAGAGIQLNIVIACFEAGYMHTLAPSAFKNKGNFFFRLVVSPLP